MTASRPSAPAAVVYRVSGSAEATERLAARLAPALEPGDVLSLEGPLGAGKTRFVTGLARAFDARTHVRSPTFTLVNEYPGPMPLFHVDLYRVESGTLEPLGLDELRERGVLAVEWGDRLPAHLSSEALRVSFSIRAPETRELAFSADAGRGVALLAACRAWGSEP
ncbi:MAG: tRNA (adenosine(37)-N6)-threonylcarbamoyltransferase complex ATPase subunit type 1 TsaE [Candidatus Eiseniibacteriota bacterium]